MGRARGFGLPPQAGRDVRIAPFQGAAHCTVDVGFQGVSEDAIVPTVCSNLLPTAIRKQTPPLKGEGGAHNIYAKREEYEIKASEDMPHIFDSWLDPPAGGCSAEKLV